MMIGRNEPCWCGSGKKYKRCHMLQDLRGEQPRGTGPDPSHPKNGEQIEGMRRAGEANGRLMDYVRPFVKAGATTASIDDRIREYTLDHGYTPACLGYHDFPRSCCVSINSVVCHGIPSEEEVLKEGDIVNVDLTTIVDGFHGDSSETFMIGTVSADARRLVGVAAMALLKGIEAVRADEPLENVARAIDPYVRSQGCSVVQQYTGHGIGREFHENFSVYHHLSRESDHVVMRPGLTFTIEPMVNLGGYRVTTDPVDLWTVRTSDGSLSAQFEHTILVGEAGAEVLTLTPSQKAAGKVLLVEGMELT